MAEEKVLKELELGIRELFRIFIPGAYAIALIQLLAPQADFSKLIAARTTSGLLGAFFLGLVGYALRAHERWFPYYVHFEKYRKVLKNAIDRVIGSSKPEDNVHIYKYFLETRADDVNDRIHYFTSFYYMLVELSLFSGAAAFFTVEEWARASTQQACPKVAVIGSVAIGFAVITQLGVAFGLRSVKTKGTKLLVYAELALAFIGLSVMLIEGYRSGHLTCDAIERLGGCRFPFL